MYLALEQRANCACLMRKIGHCHQLPQIVAPNIPNMYLALEQRANSACLRRKIGHCHQLTQIVARIASCYMSTYYFKAVRSKQLACNNTATSYTNCIYGAKKATERFCELFWALGDTSSILMGASKGFMKPAAPAATTAATAKRSWCS